jgi:hypothetical protein
MMSYRPMVKVNGSSTLVGNGLRFATREEALGNARALMNRWCAVDEVDVHESSDPVTYRWENGELVAV